jgi:hypothetical protein
MHQNTFRARVSSTQARTGAYKDCWAAGWLEIPVGTSTFIPIARIAMLLPMLERLIVYSCCAAIGLRTFVATPSATSERFPELLGSSRMARSDGWTNWRMNWGVEPIDLSLCGGCIVPKPGWKQRPLGIPTIRDRAVMMAAVLVLDPIF